MFTDPAPFTNQDGLLEERLRQLILHINQSLSQVQVGQVAGLLSTTGAISMSGRTGVRINVNSRLHRGRDSFIAAAPATRVHFNSVGNFIEISASTNTPIADSPITWGPWQRVWHEANLPMTVAPTANAGILRDAAGRAQVEAPLAAADIARLDTVTARIAPMDVAPTPNTGVLRDAAGRSQVAAPAVAADIARLDSITAVRAGAVPNTAAGVLAARNAFLGDTSNIHPDQRFLDTPNWAALDGWVPFGGADWMHGRLLVSSAPPSTGWQTAITPFFPVEPGAQYYIRCRTWNSAAGNTFTLQFASETPSTRLVEVVQMRTAMAAGGAIFEGIVTIRNNTNRGQVIIDRGTGGSGAISAGDFIVRRVFRSATVPNLTQVISNPPTQAEVLAIQNTLNQLLTNMRTAHLLAP